MDTPVARKTAHQTNVPDFAAAYYLLEGLTEVGIDYLFCNFGTDHAPIIDEMAHRRSRGEAMPGIVRCPHENSAAHMAGGYALVTGRGQGVLVHVDVGTANTGNGMHNLYRSRLPVLLMAGKAPYTVNDELVGSRDTYVHFIQEPFDQASLVRPYLKWEWTLPSGVVVKEALRRAHSIMQSEPRGPVYLMMQRETLTQHWNADEIRRYPEDRFASTSGGGADPKLVAALVDRILTAERPILITGYAGRHAHASRAIDALAQFAGIAVYEANMTNNISHDSPCFVGFAPEKAIPEADVGLLVDVDVPWFPSRRSTRAKIILGAHRHRYAQARFADVDLPGQFAHAGRLRTHPRPGARGAESQGDAALQGGSSRAAQPASNPPATSGSHAPPSSRPKRASRARSIRITSWRNSANCSTTRTSSSTKASPMRRRC